MTDFRELCAELVEYLALLDEPPHEMVCRARAALAQPEPEVVGPTDQELADAFAEGCRDGSKAGEPPFLGGARAVLARWGRAGLADGPAVPEGREPASVVGEPSDEELLATLDKATATFPPRHPEAEALNAVEYPLALELRKARAVLARFGNHSPDARKMVGPAEGDVAELVVWLRQEAEDWSQANPSGYQGARLTRAAALQQPAPLGEGLSVQAATALFMETYATAPTVQCHPNSAMGKHQRQQAALAAVLAADRQRRVQPPQGEEVR